VTTTTQKTKNKNLGIAVPQLDKKNPNSYDLSGSFELNGIKYRFGCYEKTATGEGKMKKGSKYFSFHRIEIDNGLKMSAQSSFDPAELEKM